MPHIYNQSSENMPQKVSKWKHMKMPQIKFATISITFHKLGHKIQNIFSIACKRMKPCFKTDKLSIQNKILCVIS